MGWVLLCIWVVACVTCIQVRNTFWWWRLWWQSHLHSVIVYNFCLTQLSRARVNTIVTCSTVTNILVRYLVHRNPLLDSSERGRWVELIQYLECSVLIIPFNLIIYIYIYIYIKCCLTVVFTGSVCVGISCLLHAVACFTSRIASVSSPHPWSRHYPICCALLLHWSLSQARAPDVYLPLHYDIDTRTVRQMTANHSGRAVWGIAQTSGSWVRICLRHWYLFEFLLFLSSCVQRPYDKVEDPSECSIKCL
jgi:hypothetical protein